MKSSVRHRLELVWMQLLRRFVLRAAVQESLHRYQFFYTAFQYLSFNGIDGDYAEFGCHGGRTFSMAYHQIRRHRLSARLWAYDSFQGLPPQASGRDEHPVWRAGNMHTPLEEFRRVCAERGVAAGAYTAVPGFYDDTIGRQDADAAPTKIALAYVDCDLHSSTETVLRFLAPRLRHGMIIAFDDYYCHTTTEISGERRAMLEFLAAHPQWHFLPYLQFGWAGQSFVVEDRRLLGIGREPGPV